MDEQNKTTKLVDIVFLKQFYQQLKKDHLDVLDHKKVDTNLSTLPQLPEDADLSRAFVYVDNNGASSKISISEVGRSIISTVSEVPDGMHIGQYIFLEKRDE